MMNFYDLLIIYLACGAPLGVYYYFQNRRAGNTHLLWLKTLINFLFWIPYAFQILSENKSFKNVFDFGENTDSDIEKKIIPLRKELETAIVRNIPQLSVFEAREILERYTGLTIACQAEENFVHSENEFYNITNHKNPHLAAICAARRNRERLFFHQTESRKDFLNLARESENKNLLQQTIEFAILLKDSEAQNALEKMFADDGQIENSERVKDTEIDLWKSETRKPRHINQTASARLKLSPTTMNLRSKD